MFPISEKSQTTGTISPSPHNPIKQEKTGKKKQEPSLKEWALFLVELFRIYAVLHKDMRTRKCSVSQRNANTILVSIKYIEDAFYDAAFVFRTAAVWSCSKNPAGQPAEWKRLNPDCAWAS